MSINVPKYIEITNNWSEALVNFLEEKTYSKVFILVDENTKSYCTPLFSSLQKKTIEIEIKSGEAYKILDTCTLIWKALTEENADRMTLLINLGGGVIGDMGGFCASTYKRGIDFIHIPTTLLSQVDASIGGKLGIDFNGFKNHIGLFNLPKKVIIDPIFLKTLPQNQIRSGFAEMLKHGFISNRNHLIELSRLNISSCNWLPLIEKSIGIKNGIVTSDPNEKNQRKLLNFGHTIGHAVEAYFIKNHIPILHGEAVALGMITEGYLSSKLLSFQEEEKNELIQIIDSYFERVNIPEDGLNEILTNLAQDKKNENSKIMSVMLNQIGEAQHSIEISKEEVADALKFYGSK